MLALGRRRSYQSPRGGSSAGGAGLETVLVSDAAVRILARHCTGTDTVTTADMAEKHPLQRTSTDTVSGPSDTATRQLHLVRTLVPDAVPVSDFAARPIVRAASDSVSVSSSLRIGLNPHDAATVTDSAGRIVHAVGRTTSDTLAVSENPQHVGLRIVEAGIVVDDAVRNLGFNRNASDTVAVTDSAAVTEGLHVGATETVVVSDSAKVLAKTHPIYNGIAARRQRGGVGYRR